MVDPQGTKRELKKDLLIKVLDEDDNVPVQQEQEDVHIHLNENYARKVRSIIILFKLKFPFTLPTFANILLMNSTPY